jgi:glycosyltransferase involved in cell wall biosynthesis
MQTVRPAVERKMSQRPKLMFYVPALVDGGAERLWAKLASHFHNLGHEVLFVQDFEAVAGQHHLDFEIGVRTIGRGPFRGIRRLRQIIRRHQPDVVLSAVGGSNFKLFAATRLLPRKPAIIQSFHGEYEWKSGWLSFLTAATLSATSRLTSRTIAVSDGLRTSLITRWRSSPSRTVTVTNPVAFPADIAPLRHGALDARAPQIVAVGRLVEDKNFTLLIDAIPRLKHRNAELVIVGQGSQQDALQARIDALGLNGRVRLAGFAPEPWCYYENAKCLALTSNNEAFGNVIIEAMAYGLPVVATNTHGPRSILNDDPNLGRLVPVGDADALSRALDEMLANPGDPAPRQARADTFSFSNRCPVYQRLIDEVMQEQAHGTSGRHRPTKTPGVAL